MHDYLFTSKRLGFRNWDLQDLDVMFSEINNDNEVMEFFPYKPSKEQTKEFIIRMQKMYSQLGFCYFAVDLLENSEFIGFIGMSEQSYLEELKKFVDIGWRLKKSAWQKGYATEGARACLNYGFNELKLETIYSVASVINSNSIAVMKKIGMTKVKNFDHPKLLDTPNLVSCVLYHTANQNP